MARKSADLSNDDNTQSSGDSPPGDMAGSMGLSGIFATVGNATAMVIIAGLLILVLWHVKDAHREGIDTLREMIVSDRAAHRLEREALGRIVDKNSEAMLSLANEVRLSRLSRESK